jgi:hypothetical protein
VNDVALADSELNRVKLTPSVERSILNPLVGRVVRPGEVDSAG